APGCSHDVSSWQPDLPGRILPPPHSEIYEGPPPPSGQPDQAISAASEPRPGQSLPSDNPPSEPAPWQEEAQGIAVGCGPVRILTLPEAIETAFQLQPRLRVHLESVEQARRGEDIAFAPFLPVAAASYSVGGFDLSVGGNSVPIGPIPGFTFLPALGALPIGLNINTGYEIADLKLQWLICDFGRRLGRFRQAGLAV